MWTTYVKAMQPLLDGTAGTGLLETFLPIQKFVDSLHPLDAVEFLEGVRKDPDLGYSKKFFNLMSYRVGDPTGEEARAMLAAGLDEEAQIPVAAPKEKAASRGKRKSVRAHLTRGATVEEENVEEENVEEIQCDPIPKTNVGKGRGGSIAGRRGRSRKKGVDDLQDGVEMEQQMEVELEEVVTKKRKGKRARAEDTGSDDEEEEDNGRGKRKGKRQRKHRQPKVSKAAPILNRLRPLMPAAP